MDEIVIYKAAARYMFLERMAMQQLLSEAYEALNAYVADDDVDDGQINLRKKLQRVAQGEDALDASV